MSRGDLSPFARPHMPNPEDALRYALFRAEHAPDHTGAALAGPAGRYLVTWRIKPADEEAGTPEVHLVAVTGRRELPTEGDVMEVARALMRLGWDGMDASARRPLDDHTVLITVRRVAAPAPADLATTGAP
jgi:hypothetical protein